MSGSAWSVMSDLWSWDRYDWVVEGKEERRLLPLAGRWEVPGPTGVETGESTTVVWTRVTGVAGGPGRPPTVRSTYVHPL